MRHALALGLVVVLAFAATGCGSGDPYESAAEKVVAKAKEMGKIMEGVKTASDADAAVPKLQAISKDLKAISDDLKKQPKATEEQKKKVRKVFEDSKKDMESAKANNNTKNLPPEVMQKLAPALMEAAFSMMGVMMQLEAQNFGPAK